MMAEEREGNDITAADMVPPPEDPSEIVEFYTNSTIFLTGATGYLGKMFLEKLLRTCTGLTRIYILVRAKKNKDVQQRFEEVFEGPNFDPLRRQSSDFGDKVTLVAGDCSLPDLGLSDTDKAMLIREVDCIIHCAATVRFDEEIRMAAYINVRAVRDLVKIAQEMKRLRAMLYVSTAFSNCVRKTIDEQFYEPPITGDKLLTLVDSLDDLKLNKITPIILGDYPNTYVFTKAVAENVVQQYAKKLPIAVYRPAIVIASVKEPVAGWIDNFYGATGVMIGAALGLLRSLHGKKENVAEMVPADYVVNCGLAALWDIATIKTLNDNKEIDANQTSREEKFEKEIPVYNYVSSPEKKITWREFASLAEKHAPQVPSPLIVWYYFFEVRSSRIRHLLAVFFYHTVPAYIVDLFAICLRKKPMLVKGYRKIDKFGEVISYFAMREWQFRNGNVQALWQRLNKQDQALFEFSMKNVNWDVYFYTYVRGARAYLLKDPLDTIEAGAIKYFRLKLAHYTLVGVVFSLLFYCTYYLLSFCFIGRLS